MSRVSWEQINGDGDVNETSQMWSCRRFVAVAAGTLLQPKMNKRKSVSKMTEKDTRDATKYVLTHQTVDSEGDLETNLVKVRLSGVAQCGLPKRVDVPLTVYPLTHFLCLGVRVCQGFVILKGTSTSCSKALQTRGLHSNGDGGNTAVTGGKPQ